MTSSPEYTKRALESYKATIDYYLKAAEETATKFTAEANDTSRREEDRIMSRRLAAQAAERAYAFNLVLDAFKSSGLAEIIS